VLCFCSCFFERMAGECSLHWGSVRAATGAAAATASLACPAASAACANADSGSLVAFPLVEPASVCASHLVRAKRPSTKASAVY
jgi:hypothetical protein